MSMRDLLSSFQGKFAASLNAITEAEQAIGSELPDDYKQFLFEMDGGEGFIGEGSYVILWSVGELAGFNAEYESANYCPDVLLIGSNGGGEAFGIDSQGGVTRYVQVPFVGMSRSLIDVVSTTFDGFLASLATRT